MDSPEREYESFVEVVVEVIGEVAPHVDDVREGTTLLGERAVVDSVGFISLLIAVEQRLNGRVDLAASFLDHGTSSDEANPFRSVGTLARHLRALSGTSG